MNDFYGPNCQVTNQAHLSSGYAGKNNEGLANSAQAKAKSPVDQELHILSGRLDSIASLLNIFVNQLNPVLRADITTDSCVDKARPAGESELHEKILCLNEKASDIARYIDHTHSRVTV